MGLPVTRTDIIKSLMKMTEVKTIVPTWLKVWNIFILFPISIWPFLFFNVDDMLESSMKCRCIIFVWMLIYPVVLLGNVFLTYKLFKRGHRKTAIFISLLLGVLVAMFMHFLLS